MSHVISELHNIMPIANLKSVMMRGILCYDLAQKLEHKDVSMSDIQNRRRQIRIPNGMRLHQYANLYFHARNPMLYVRKDQSDQLCILQISPDILQLDDVVVTDMNASRQYVRFRPAAEVNLLNFERIYAQYWTHQDKREEYLHKGQKCAEVLVPKRVASEYIVGAYVVSLDVKQKVIETGFPHPVTINRHLFFR